MAKWLMVAALLVGLTGCGPSAYEKAQAKAAAAKLMIEEAELRLENIRKIPVGERSPEILEATKLWEADIEQGRQDLKVATEQLRDIGN